MVAASAWSVALLGAEGTMVEVEAAIGGGQPRTVMVGLPDTALYESRDRCKAAVAAANLTWPDKMVTINLTPASLPKAGTHFDLAVVAAVLAASGAVPRDLTGSCVLMGEVGLDARVRSVRGVLPALLAARAAGFTKAVVPDTQVGEAMLVDGMTVWGIRSVEDLVEVLNGRPVMSSPAAAQPTPPASTPGKDLSDIAGHGVAKWCLEVAAAGRHHVLFSGPPGVGKTMLAERLPGLLPDLDDAEALEVSALHSLVTDVSDGLIRRPPFSDPHHSSSVPSLVGGGSRIARPGAISLAHRGVLFLDEAPEFSLKALDALRTPLESGWVTLARTQSTVRYPARFQLVLAANPCPCGNHGVRGAQCRCNPIAIRRYQEKLSGPMRDRIDIQLHLTAPPEAANLGSDAPRGESSETVRGRVELARDRQRFRLGPLGWSTNAEVPGPVLRRSLPIPASIRILEDAVRRGSLSPRGVDKVWRIAWTLADLDGQDAVAEHHLRGALMLRHGDELEMAA